MISALLCVSGHALQHTNLINCVFSELCIPMLFAKLFHLLLFLRNNPVKGFFQALLIN